MRTAIYCRVSSDAQTVDNQLLELTVALDAFAAWRAAWPNQRVRGVTTLAVRPDRRGHSQEAVRGDSVAI